MVNQAKTTPPEPLEDDAEELPDEAILNFEPGPEQQAGQQFLQSKLQTGNPPAVKPESADGTNTPLVFFANKTSGITGLPKISSNRDAEGSSMFSLAALEQIAKEGSVQGKPEQIQAKVNEVLKTE